MISVNKLPHVIVDSKNYPYSIWLDIINKEIYLHFECKKRKTILKRFLYDIDTPAHLYNMFFRDTKIFYDMDWRVIVFDIGKKIIIFEIENNYEAVSPFDKIISTELTNCINFCYFKQQYFVAVAIGKTLRIFGREQYKSTHYNYYSEFYYLTFSKNIKSIKYYGDYLKFDIYFYGDVSKTLKVLEVFREEDNLKNSAEWYLLKKVGRDVLSEIKKYLK